MMSKRNLLNLSLLLTVIGLVLLVIYEPGKPEPKPLPKLTALNADAVTRIEINRHNAANDKKKIVLLKKEQGWIMQQPWQLPASPYRIEAMLKLLTAVSLSQNDLGKLKPANFGLEKPLLSVKFNDTQIDFGHNKSLNYNRYVRIGSTLHMIEDRFYYQLVAKAEAYLDHRLLPEKSTIKLLDLPQLRLSRAENGSWKTEPQGKNWSADTLNKLVEEWKLSQAFDIEKTVPEKDLRPDITIEFENGKRYRFKIESSKQKFSLVDIDRGLRFMLSADRKDRLLQPASDKDDTP